MTPTGDLRLKVLRGGVLRPGHAAIEVRLRDEWSRRFQRMVHRELRFDVETDTYVETLRDVATGEELWSKSERLSTKRPRKG